MKVERPIFIIGLGRSGSTVFFDILSNHPELIWLSKRISNRYPGRPELNRTLMNFINVPIMGKFMRRLYEPGECYPYWDYLYRGFSSSYRDLLDQDVTSRALNRIRDSFNAMMKNPSDRLVIKITGWNRMRFLRAIFPDALFIHVERDTKAVINSFLNVYFWSGWEGPLRLLSNIPTDEQRNELERFDHSFVALAGINIEQHMEAYYEARATIPLEQLFEVSYEELCADPEFIYRKTCKFCDLEFYEAFRRVIRRTQLKNSNYKWQQDLTDKQQEIAQYYHEKLAKKYSKLR